MKTAALRVIMDYDRLDNEFKEQVILSYPDGFSDSIVEFIDNKSRIVNAIRFQKEEKIFLLRLSKKMVNRLREGDTAY